MVRVKKGETAKKHRKHLLKHARGFRWGRKSKFRAAKDALFHAWQYAYRDRKAKKREFRALWQGQINTACRENNLPFNRFIYGLKKNKIALNRKILALLSQNHSEIFKKIVEKAKI